MENTSEPAKIKIKRVEAARILLWDRRLVGRECLEVGCFDKELVKLRDVLIATCHQYEGVGLAAPQISQFVRAAVVCWPQDKEPLFLANPELDPIHCSGNSAFNEGCLSLPGVTGRMNRRGNLARVIRNSKIAYKYQDITGKVIEAVEEDPFRARVIQHEIDHLTGIFFIDRCSPVYRSGVLKRFERFKKTLVKA